MGFIRLIAASLKAPASSRSFASSARPAFRAAPGTPVITRHPKYAFRRGYSTEAPKEGGNSVLWLTLGAVVAAGGGYWYYTQSDDGATIAKSAKQAGKAIVGFTPKQGDYQKVYNKVAELLDDAGEYDDGSYGPVLVRLAWHASGTFDKTTGTGGSNYATMRFAPESLHGANNGLNVARSLMEGVKKDFPWISYGDLWTLAGVAAIQESGGPKVPWRPGRIDGFEKDATPDGRLPDAALGSDHIRNIFERMGFNDQEMVALIGAHALGRCHPDRSGFEGPWTFSPTSFTNEFYKLLLNEKWQWRKWNGPKQLEDKKTKSLMMLPADYALVTDKKFKEVVKRYAEDEHVFFKDFSAAFSRLLELGVPTSQWVSSTPWEMQSLSEQKKD